MTTELVNWLKEHNFQEQSYPGHNMFRFYREVDLDGNGERYSEEHIFIEQQFSDIDYRKNLYDMNEYWYKVSYTYSEPGIRSPRVEYTHKYGDKYDVTVEDIKKLLDFFNVKL